MMKLKPTIKTAVENTATKKRVAGKGETVLKEGTPLDHTKKHDVVRAEGRTVGLNKGITKNMDNFESLRIDCWLTDDVRDGETVEQALERLSKVIDKQIQLEVERVLDS